jgi:conjugal transfer pilus assembly protein TraK
VNKRKLLLAMFFVSASLSANASANGLPIPAGIPSEMLQGIAGGSEKELPPKEQEVSSAEVVEPGVKSESPKKNGYDTIRDEIRSYLNREVKGLKAATKEGVEKSRRESGKEKSTPSVVQRTPTIKKERRLVDSGKKISAGYQIPEGAVEVKVSNDGVAYLDGSDSRSKVVAISRGLSNKIITPFANPVINSASKLTVTIEKNTIFIGSNSPKVSGVWIYDEGKPDVSVPIILMPKPIPPVTMEIIMPRSKLFGDESIPKPKIERIRAVDIPVASKIESSSHFDKSIIDMMDLLIDKRQYPDGYGVVDFHDSPPGLVCGHKEIQGKMKHRLEGDIFDVEILSIKNFSQYPAAVTPSRCYSDGIVAVTANPPNYLAPGEVGELILVKLGQKYLSLEESKKEKLRPVSSSKEW